MKMNKIQNEIQVARSSQKDKKPNPTLSTYYQFYNGGNYRMPGRKLVKYHDQ